MDIRVIYTFGAACIGAALLWLALIFALAVFQPANAQEYPLLHEHDAWNDVMRTPQRPYVSPNIYQRHYMQQLEMHRHRQEMQQMPLLNKKANEFGW